jgi:hypothetical protein
LYWICFLCSDLCAILLLLLLQKSLRTCSVAIIFLNFVNSTATRFDQGNGVRFSFSLQI